MTNMKNIIANFKHYWFLMTQLISRDLKLNIKDLFWVLYGVFCIQYYY